jgi:hypothetical protein
MTKVRQVKITMISPHQEPLTKLCDTAVRVTLAYPETVAEINIHKSEEMNNEP